MRSSEFNRARKIFRWSRMICLGEQSEGYWVYLWMIVGTGDGLISGIIGLVVLDFFGELWFNTIFDAVESWCIE